VLHHSVESWGDPQAFRPERWLTPDGRYDENAPGQPRGAFLPFGAGSHVCVGASFAWTEAVLVLATLARDWSLHATFDELPMRALATLRPARKVTMRVTRAAATMSA
jgi:cytochrome P450